MEMLISSEHSPRRCRAGSGRRASRFLSAAAVTGAASLAVALGTAPAASAQSTLEADGRIAVSSLGSTATLPAALGSLGSLGPDSDLEYVALGDSFAAVGADSQPAEGPGAVSCQRSLANYPNQLAADPRIGTFVDATCAGAQIPDFSAPQHDDVPPQYESLGTDTNLVTLSIGGNDVGFGTIVGCITKQGPFVGAPECEPLIGDEIDANIAAVGPALDAVYAEIESRSPEAIIITTQYMPLMPEVGTSCAFTDQLNPADVDWAREVTADINAAVEAAATRNGHVSVMPDPIEGHSACAGDDERYTSFLGAGDDTQGMHPTALGQQAMAEAIAAAIPAGSPAGLPAL